MPTPRVFIIRHGETEWSLNGRHTGSTDIPLTANGEKRIRATGRAMVGPDRLIVPKKLAHIFVSPRKRAQRTFELLNIELETGTLPWQAHGGEACQGLECSAKVEITEDIREWDYGDYEGITSAEIRKLRAEQGFEGSWDIWRDGCPGGDELHATALTKWLISKHRNPQQVTARLDKLIAHIRDKFHKPVLDGASSEASGADGDILIVAHGHILRAFAMRWAGKTLQDGPAFLLEAGGVGTLSYEHHNVDEPAILLGGAFVVDIAEKGIQKE